MQDTKRPGSLLPFFAWLLLFQDMYRHGYRLARRNR
jgi:hypothetical protein